MDHRGILDSKSKDFHVLVNCHFVYVDKVLRLEKHRESVRLD